MICKRAPIETHVPLLIRANKKTNKKQKTKQKQKQKQTKNPIQGFVWRNWAQTQKMKPKYVHTPKTEADIKAIILFAQQHQQKVKVDCT